MTTKSSNELTVIEKKEVERNEEDTNNDAVTESNGNVEIEEKTPIYKSKFFLRHLTASIFLSSKLA